MSLEYQHANKIIDVSGNSLWLGDIQSADSRHWLKQNNIKTGTDLLIEWSQLQMGSVWVMTNLFGIISIKYWILNTRI